MFVTGEATRHPARRQAGTERPGGQAEAERLRRRAVAIWLALLAAHRGGLIKRLVGKEATLTEVVALPEAQLRRCVGPSRVPAKTSSPHGEGIEADCERLAAAHEPPRTEEEPAFTRILAAGPGRLRDVLAMPSGVQVVTWEDEAYPSQLRDLRDAPPALFLRGRVREGLQALERSPVVAIVGTRGPSPYGVEMARAIARDLAAAGVLVISGLASGIDAVAQSAAMDAVRQCADTGAATGRAGATEPASPTEPAAATPRARRFPAVSTVGVLGCGVDVVYPKSNASMFREVRATGLLVSEFPPGTPARAWRFPARNRVIAGLARAVLVVEGGERSGSLLTADFAEQIQRDVLAVPGEAGRRLSAGPHRLLRAGAHLCESADDVLEVIGLRSLGWTTRRAGLPGDGTGPLAAAVTALDAGERSIDEVAALLGCRAPEAAAMLASLEVEGVVQPAGGGRYRLCRDGGRP